MAVDRAPTPATGADDWTAPGAFEVAPGVHRIPLPLPNDGLRAVNVYAIEDGDALVLVDAGWDVPETRPVLAAGLAAIGCSLGDIGQFLVTHAHRDHYSEAVALRQELGVTVRLGHGERASLDVLTSPGWEPLAPQLQLLRSCGAAPVADELSAAVRHRGGTHGPLGWGLPDEWLFEGPLDLASGRRLAVVETPGHTRGHVVFHDPAAGLLFAGDHVLPTITPSIGFEPALSPDPLGAFLGSLAKVRQLPDAVLLPAHGPVATSAHARVDELVDHHGRRLDEVERAVAAGASTPFEVAGRLRWTRRERALDDLDPFNKMLAVAETWAHLVLLTAQGRLVASGVLSPPTPPPTPTPGVSGGGGDVGEPVPVDTLQYRVS